MVGAHLLCSRHTNRLTLCRPTDRDFYEDALAQTSPFDGSWRVQSWLNGLKDVAKFGCTPHCANVLQVRAWQWGWRKALQSTLLLHSRSISQLSGAAATFTHSPPRTLHRCACLTAPRTRRLKTTASGVYTGTNRW